jgi:hypothetical protein
MPVASLWTILISLALLAFSLTLKIAELQRTVKDTDKELDLLRAELDALKKHEHETKSEAPRFNPQPEKKKTGRAVDFTGVHLR